MRIKCDHQTFEEHLFVHRSIIIVLHCIICLETLERWSSKLLNIILRHYWEIWSENWYLYAFYVSSLLHCYKDLIDLHYNLNFILLSGHINISNCTKLHIFLSLGLRINVSVFSLIFSLYATWGIKIKYDTQQKPHIQTFFRFFF